MARDVERWNQISRELLEVAHDIDGRYYSTEFRKNAQWKKKRIAARLRELASVIQDQWEADDLAEEMDLAQTVAGTD